MIKTEENYDANALMAIPSLKDGASEIAIGLRTWDRPQLTDYIRENGVDAFFARGRKSFDETTSTVLDVIRPEYSSDYSKSYLKHMGEMSIKSFGVLRNIITNEMQMDEFLPVLNPHDLRYQVGNKFEMAKGVYIPAKSYERNIELIDGSDDIEKIESIPGDIIVAKPNRGSRSRDIMVGNKSYIKNELTKVDSPFIVEEKLNFTHSMPMIKGQDKNEQSKLDEANREMVNRELRIYYFGYNTWDSVVRVADKGKTDFKNDRWLYIKQDSIPYEVMEKSEQIVDYLRKTHKTDEFNIALDWVYASSESNPDPRWLIMELNAGEPQIVWHSEDAEVGERQHRKLAEQISRIAKNTSERKR